MLINMQIGRITERGVLKGEGHNVLDALDGHGEGVSRETLADDDFYPPKIIGRAPVALLKKLLAENREFEAFKITILGEF